MKPENSSFRWSNVWERFEVVTDSTKIWRKIRVSGQTPLAYAGRLMLLDQTDSTTISRNSCNREHRACYGNAEALGDSYLGPRGILFGPKL